MSEKSGDLIDVTTGWVNLTTKCNNRCAWCYRSEDFLAPPEVMSLSLAHQVVDFFGKLGIYSCIFIGGEPTLYPGLPKLIRQAKICGIPEITVVSNGRKYKHRDYVRMLAAEGLDHFSISIHSSDRESHNSICGTSSWDDTIQGIQNVVAEGYRCTLNLIAGRRNYDSVLESIPFLLQLGVKQVIVSCAIPYISENGINGLEALDPKLFAQLVEKLVMLDERVVILHELPLCILSRSTFLKLVESNRLGYGCHVGIGRGLSINVDGSVIPCNSFAHHALVNFFENGKLKYTPEEFLQLWGNNLQVLEVRKEVNVYRSSICKECDLWMLCNCGCPMTWGSYDPNAYINNGLYGIPADHVYQCTTKKYNP